MSSKVVYIGEGAKAQVKEPAVTGGKTEQKSKQGKWEQRERARQMMIERNMAKEV